MIDTTDVFFLSQGDLLFALQEIILPMDNITNRSIHIL